MSEKNLLQVTPWLLASDVKTMVQFFVEVLGFHTWVQDEFYAYVSRDDAAVRIGKLSEGADGAEERVEWGARAWLFYIDVRDVDALVAELRPRLQAAGLDGGKGPKDQSWGKREFWAPLPEADISCLDRRLQRPHQLSDGGVALSYWRCVF